MSSSMDSLFSPLFAHHLEASPPEFLYHYTNGDGLLGIVQSSALWATKIDYLNDSTEFRGALDMLEERLTQEFDLNDTFVDPTTLPRRKQVALLLWKATNKIDSASIFVICFCMDGDILSQWRGYSASSYGYSVGFKTEKLITFATNAGFVLGKCIYEKSMQQAIIDEMCNYCLSSPKSGNDIVGEMAKALIQCGAFFKDRSFEEEDEWRLVSRGLGISISDVKFRRGESMITPYIVLPIATEANSSIDHVYIGPCPHMGLSERSMWTLLVQKGITGGVHCSRIPFRDW